MNADKIGTTEGTKESCQCYRCVGACKSKPGWFAPGEAEKAAEYLGLTTKEFFDEYLSVDWWVGDEDIYILSPSVTRIPEQGGMFSGGPRGVCIFLKDDKCSIHEVKPEECRAMIHGERTDTHEKISQKWNNASDQSRIVELLGYEPFSEFTSFLDILE